MKIITVASQKGGCGKSTTIINAAVCAAREGFKVLLLDLDQQQSLAKWRTRRGEDDNIKFQVTQGNNLDGLKVALKNAAPHFDICFIDSPPSDAGWTKDIVPLSDYMVIPVRPAFVDIEAMKPMITAARHANVPYSFYVNQVIPRDSGVQAAMDVIGQHGTVCPTFNHIRVSIHRAPAQGKGVVETGDERGGQEATFHWNFIRKEVGLEPKVLVEA